MQMLCSEAYSSEPLVMTLLTIFLRFDSAELMPKVQNGLRTHNLNDDLSLWPRQHHQCSDARNRLHLQFDQIKKETLLA